MLGEGRVLYLDRDMSFVHDSASVMHCSLTAVAAVADQHGGRKSLTKNRRKNTVRFLEVRLTVCQRVS